MLIRKKIVQVILVLGWLVWSLPVFAAGGHEAKSGEHPGKQGSSHGGHLEANTEGIVENMELKENTVVMDMVVAKVRQKISLHIFEKGWMPMAVK